MEFKELFEPIINFIKGLQNKDKENSKDEAKKRLQLVLMQDRASVSPDFFEMMKKEIIEVIKKYIEIDEEALEVQLTRGFEDGVTGPALFANIPIKNIKPVAKKNEEPKEEKSEKEENKKEEEKQDVPAQASEQVEEDNNENKNKQEDKKENADTIVSEDNKQDENKEVESEPVSTNEENKEQTEVIEEPKKVEKKSSKTKGKTKKSN